MSVTPGRAPASPGGSGAKGARTLGPRRRGVELGVEHLALEGADGHLVPAGRPGSPFPKRNKVGRLDLGDQAKGGVGRCRGPDFRAP